MKKLKFICGEMEWTIRWVKKLDGCKGLTETATNTVLIDNSFDKRTKRHVVLHEIFHVIWYSYHLNPPKDFKYNHTEVSHGMSSIEEYMCSTCSQFLLQVMNDNPELKDYIFGDN